MEGTSLRDSLYGGLERMHGLAPGLQGVTGRLRIEVCGKLLGCLAVVDGDVEFVPGDGEAGTVVDVASHEDLQSLLLGELNPVVATLQGRLAVEGDIELASRIVLGLQSGSPFHGDLFQKES